MPRPDVRDERIPQILNAAMDVFSQHGINGASMSQIAKVSGLSKATIYHYFESKDALVEALVTRLFDADMPFLDDLLAAEGTVIVRMRDYLKGLATLLQNNQKFYPILSEIRALSARDAQIHQIIKGYFEHYQSGFERILAQGIERGELRATLDVATVGQTLIAVIEGAIIIAHDMQQPLEPVLQRSVQTILVELQV